MHEEWFDDVKFEVQNFRVCVVRSSGKNHLPAVWGKMCSPLERKKGRLSGGLIFRKTRCFLLFCMLNPLLMFFKYFGDFQIMIDAHEM